MYIYTYIYIYRGTRAFWLVAKFSMLQAPVYYDNKFDNHNNNNNNDNNSNNDNNNNDNNNSNNDNKFDNRVQFWVRVCALLNRSCCLRVL